MSKFTVEDRAGCVIIYDPVPIKWFERFAGMIEGAVVSPDLARMLGASFAFGRPEDIDALKAELAPGAEQRALEKYGRANVSEAAARWLATGERGSSNTLFTRITGVDAIEHGGADHPYDPDDFRRCRLLLEQCPEIAEHLDKMSAESPAWAGLVENWDAICLTMDAENPDWRSKRGSAPRTYHLIQQATGRK